MANPVITSRTAHRGVVHLEASPDDLVQFAGADTYVHGTILARKKVVTAITPGAVSGTGNGTCTAASVVTGPVVPLVGSYKLECIEAITNGGVFKLEDPNGMIVAAYLALTVGAGGTTVFEVAGMIFTITDGSTDFAVGDTFALPIVADGDLVAFASAGVGGAQEPLKILIDEIIVTGAADKPCRPMAAGVFKYEYLVIDADGDNSNVTAEIKQKLQAAGIRIIGVPDRGALDNA